MLKLLFSFVAFAAFVWFGATVDLGPRTLFGHLYNIGRSPQSQELVEGTKESAKPLVDDVRRRIAGTIEDQPTPRSPTTAGPDAGLPQETISSADRQELRKLIGAARPSPTQK
jgi:hypothetical protein